MYGKVKGSLQRSGRVQSLSPMSHRRRNVQKLCLSRGRTKISRTIGTGSLGLLGLNERDKAQVLISSIILLKGKETETHTSCRSTPGCTVIVMFRALAPINMNPLQGIRAAKEKQDSPDKVG